MGQILINVSPEEHNQLKEAAAKNGKPLDAYILEKVLPQDDDEVKALEDLTNFLLPRVESAKNGEFSNQTLEQIASEVRQKRGNKSA